MNQILVLLFVVRLIITLLNRTGNILNAYFWASGENSTGQVFFRKKVTHSIKSQNKAIFSVQEFYASSKHLGLPSLCLGMAMGRVW